MVASKRILIVCPVIDQPEGEFARALCRDLENANVPIMAPTSSDIHWDDFTEVRNYFAIHKPFIVLCIFPFGEALKDVYANEDSRKYLLTLTQNVAAVSKQSDSHLILLSDYHVFGAETKSTYSETDPVSPLDGFGEFLVGLENCVATNVEEHIILRFGWLIGLEPGNLFSDILDSLVLGGEKTVSHYRRGSPTWQGDALRVLIGVVRQVMSGSKNWGIYHYCSADNCNEWEFGQEVLSTLTRIQAPVGGLIAPVDKNSDGSKSEPASATLSCHRIRNNFGVQPRTWRQGLKSNIENWLEQNAQQKCVS